LGNSRAKLAGGGNYTKETHQFLWKDLNLSPEQQIRYSARLDGFSR
jgi:hypothetical protein